MANNKDFSGLIVHGKYNAELGGIVGLLVGDALGVNFEFKTPNLIPPRDKIEMTPPDGFRCSHSGVANGTWSDDGAQALCLFASLLECGKFSLSDFSTRLLRWLDHGYMAVDDEVFDVGMQTAEALDRLREGVSPRESGGATVMDNGNGSLMRVLPLALWHTGTDEALVLDAHLQSMPTHAHPRSLVACAFYCLVARGYLSHVQDPWSDADARLEAVYDGWTDRQERAAYLRELDVLRRFPKTDTPLGTGYVLDTIWSAHVAMQEESFEDVVRTAIMFGNDTDTTSAVAAGLAGVKFKMDGIPTRWLEQLSGFNLAEPLVVRFLESVGENPQRPHTWGKP